MTLMLRNVLAIVVLLGVAWLLSSNRRRVPWRVILVGLGLQILIAWLMLRTPIGLEFMHSARIAAEQLINCVDGGCEFVFGADFREHFFAFKVLPAIIFVGALTSVLYHFGILQRVIFAIGWVMQRTMGTTGAESLCAAANIFVGQTEAPLVVRPYVARMTNSELMTVMVAGMATIAGGVMAAFISMGIDAGHLLTASVISAPAALMVAKLLHPETESPEGAGELKVAFEVESVNAFDAACLGAREGLMLALNVGAMIIAFLGLIALVDLGLAQLSPIVGTTWSLSGLLGIAAQPLAWLLGVTPGDEHVVGELIGLKIVTNEFLAYERLLELQQSRAISDHSMRIAIYALCGFANIGSIGIQIGGLGLLAPNRRADLARMGLKAMIGGNIASFLTACVAGLVGQ